MKAKTLLLVIHLNIATTKTFPLASSTTTTETSAKLSATSTEQSVIPSTTTAEKSAKPFTTTAEKSTKPSTPSTKTGAKPSTTTATKSANPSTTTGERSETTGVSNREATTTSFTTTTNFNEETTASISAKEDNVNNKVENNSYIPCIEGVSFCKNNGDCFMNLSKTTEKICRCLKAYTGDTCEIPIATIGSQRLIVGFAALGGLLLLILIAVLWTLSRRLKSESEKKTRLDIELKRVRNEKQKLEMCLDIPFNSGTSTVSSWNGSSQQLFPSIKTPVVSLEIPTFVCDDVSYDVNCDVTKARSRSLVMLEENVSGIDAMYTLPRANGQKKPRTSSDLRVFAISKGKSRSLENLSNARIVRGQNLNVIRDQKKRLAASIENIHTGHVVPLRTPVVQSNNRQKGIWASEQDRLRDATFY